MLAYGILMTILILFDQQVSHGGLRNEYNLGPRRACRLSSAWRRSAVPVAQGGMAGRPDDVTSAPLTPVERRPQDTPLPYSPGLGS